VRVGAVQVGLKDVGVGPVDVAGIRDPVSGQWPWGLRRGDGEAGADL
jgi:hypothetical protein